LPSSLKLEHIIPFLDDPVRAVRTEAARVLSSVAKDSLNASVQSRLDVVLEELKVRYTSNLDRPESHLSLGILSENLGEPHEAEKHYRNAMVRDELFVPARLNLATLLSGQGRNEEAEEFLRESVRLQPTWGQIHYSLGLLIAEDRARLSEAIRSLERAAGYMPENTRVTYNLGIAYWQAQRVGDAARSFLHSIKLSPDNPEFRQRISELYAQNGMWAESVPHLRHLVNLVPDRPDFKAFLRQAESSIR